MEWMCIKIKQGSTHRQITMHAHSIDFNYAKLCEIASFFHFTTKNDCVRVCVYVFNIVDMTTLTYTASLWIASKYAHHSLDPLNIYFPHLTFARSHVTSLLLFPNTMHCMKRNQMMWRIYGLKNVWNFAYAAASISPL